MRFVESQLPLMLGGECSSVHPGPGVRGNVQGRILGLHLRHLELHRLAVARERVLAKKRMASELPGIGPYHTIGGRQ